MASDATEGIIALFVVLLFTALVIVGFGISVTPRRIAGIGAGILILVMFNALVSNASIDQTTGFVIFSVGIFSLVSIIVPGVVIDAFSPVLVTINDFFGTDVFSNVNALYLAIVAFTLPALMLAFKERITPGGRVFIDKIANKVLGRYAIWVDRYVAVLMLVLLFLAGVLTIFLQQAGDLIGTFGDLMAQIPLFFANVATFVAGYLSLGGELPYIGSIPLFGDLSAEAYLIFGLTVIFIAVAVRQSGSGPLPNFLRR